MKASELKAELTDLVRDLIPTIADDYRSASQELGDETPSMDLTIGCDGDSWSYQTGDNSFTGGAYGYADWSVTTLYRDSKPEDVAEELVRQFDSEGWDFESGEQQS